MYKKELKRNNNNIMKKGGRFLKATGVVLSLIHIYSEGNVVDLPSKLFNEIAPKYADRVGGYTRILKTGKTLWHYAKILSQPVYCLLKN